MYACAVYDGKVLPEAGASGSPYKKQGSGQGMTRRRGEESLRPACKKYLDKLRQASSPRRISRTWTADFATGVPGPKMAATPAL